MTVCTSLRDLDAAYSDAMLRGDAEALTAFYTEDAVFYAPGIGVDARGREAIEQAYRELLAAITVLEFPAPEGDLTVVGDVAYGHRRFMTRARANETGDEERFEVWATEVFRRGSDDGWRYVIDHATRVGSK